MDQELERRIRERAYEIWQEEGRPEGREAQHWRQAAGEFAEARREGGTATPGRRTRKASPAMDAGSSAKKAKSAPGKSASRGAKASSTSGAKGRGGKSKAGQ